MASANSITLLDIVRANGSDGITGLVDETIRATPEVMYGAARTIKGINYKTLIRTALGTVAFRDGNSGASIIKSSYENKLIECFLLNPRIQGDKMVCDTYEDGAEAYLAMEASGVMNASLQRLGKQFYYGRNSAIAPAGYCDAKGFPGLIDFVDTSLVLDAGGTTATTGSSVWFVAFRNNMVNWVFGENGQMTMTPTRLQDIYDANNNPYTAYVQELCAHPGLQCVNNFSVVRIKNITADAGHTLNDALLGRALALLPAAFQPMITDIFMAPRSVEQLRASRTAVNPTGAPAPTPTDFQGIPIRNTDSIAITETLN